MRTKDDALITVKQMVFFELRDIETMLNQTADPIADFIKSVWFYSTLYFQSVVQSLKIAMVLLNGTNVNN